MSRKAAQVPFTEDDLVSGELRGAPRTRRWLTVTVVTVSLVVVGAVAYLAVFAPDHYAQFHAERAAGSTQAVVGDGVTVTPGEGWVSQPRVTDLLNWSPLPPLRDWAVLTGAETGVQLRSPDHELTVELSIDHGEGPRAALWLGDGTVRTETLASGAQLQHVDGEHEMRAIVTLGAREVRVTAHTEGDLAAYRPALSALLESLNAS
ncbi:hypothetical protein JOF28_001979 [Leucobacter exalbidus]|uniref:DUF4245 domain-containing protein n=1 Tax=Leucobacter exalbidus TaxID=662960 RepID=A0A940T411_9MICO|nr:hypothetical protein [Leucobacter exalbidus]MBP1326747.1 hypothetical protein [Leucobacter exalbidus]